MAVLAMGATAVAMLGWVSVQGQNANEADYADPARYLNKGADFNNPAFDAKTYGIDPETIDQSRDYSFGRLDDLSSALEGVDRRRVLRDLFESVTIGAETDTERHERVAYFLQRASYHNTVWQPLHREGGAVYDPLVLLELGETRCGNISRIAADMFEAAGYDARIVQLGGHVIAELFYEGGWHYFDADLFGGGRTVWHEGHIPSVAELAEAPGALDALPSYYEGNPRWDGSPYPSYFYFSEAAYVGYRPMYYNKTASEGEEQNELYGWNHYETITEVDFVLADLPLRRQPGAPVMGDVQITDGMATLTWRPSVDGDGDLLDYRVYVGSHPRGWAYGGGATGAPTCTTPVSACRRMTLR